MQRESLINLVVIAILLAVPVLAHFAGQPYIVTVSTKILILAIAGIGLNIALGLGGMVSLGHAAFFGIGGYAMGILASHAQNFTPIISFPFAVMGTKNMLVIWLVAIVAAALFALVIGFFSLRTKGVYFIMITLAFAQMLYYFAISWPAYGGEDGLSIYVRNQFPGLNTLDPIQFFAVVALVFGVVLFFVSQLSRSRFALALEATRQSEDRVEAVGIAPLNLKLTAFVISATVTAIAGALYADLNRFVSPSMLSWHMSGEIMVFVILGGVGRLFGPVIGAALYVLLEQLLGGVNEYWQFYFGIILLLLVLFTKGGMIGFLTREKRHG